MCQECDADRLNGVHRGDRTHPEDKGRDRPSHPDPGSRGKIGWIVAGSLATEWSLLAARRRPVHPGRRTAVTGAVLCGFALGWAVLAVLSVRFTDQPQRWAAAPALFMGVGGLLLVGFAPGAPGAQLGVAPGHAGVGRLDDRLCPSTAAYGADAGCCTR